jgi:hypothetical protein
MKHGKGIIFQGLRLQTVLYKWKLTMNFILAPINQIYIHVPGYHRQCDVPGDLLPLNFYTKATYMHIA